MTRAKKLLALGLALVLTLGLAGCREADVSYAAQIGETKVPVGVYIYQILQALDEAYALVEDPEGNLLKQEIDGTDSATWIQTRADEMFYNFCIVEKKYAELGLALAADEKSYAEQMSSYYWQYLQNLYMANGVAQKSLIEVFGNDIKKQAVFFAEYGEGGTKTPSAQEIEAHFAENYLRTSYIAMPKKDNDVAITEEQLAERQALIDTYYDRLVTGESYELIVTEHQNLSAAEGEELPEVALGEYDNVFSKTDTSYSDAFREATAAAEIGVPYKAEDDDYIYVAIRREIMQDYDTTSITDATEEIIYELKFEEFEAELKGANAAEIEGVTINADAVKKWPLSKIAF